MFKSGFMKGIAEVSESTCVTSDAMLDAIDLWTNLYEGNPPWMKNCHNVSLGIPAVIASEFARSVTLEMGMSVAGSPMADYLSEQIQSVLDNIRTDTEYACACGGIVFKPYVSGYKIVTEIIHADTFLPIAFDSSGRVTAAYFVYRHWEGRRIYSRLEKHELNGTDYSVTNQCYVSMFEGALGKECSLTEVGEWADIQPEVLMHDIEAPLFSYFRIPLGNTVDKNSPLGVSVYARAVSLIQKADKIFDSLLWEYIGGELALNANEDAFAKRGGEPIVPEGKERLFWINQIDSATQTNTPLFDAWSPSLRDSNYINGLNRILMQIEDACSLSRGVLSDPDTVARTSTEMKIMKQRSYAAVTDIQKSLETALDGLLYAMYCIATLYELAPEGQYTASYTWDDSIIVDAEAERVRDQQEVRDGLMAKWEYRKKWRGEDEATAKKMISEIEGQPPDLSDDEILGFGKEPEMTEET